MGDAGQNVSPGGPNPPQLNSLSADTHLLTLTIGGNDIGFSDLAGRDACAGSGTRWVELYVPGNAAAPLHPNLRGMQAMAAMVVANR